MEREYKMEIEPRILELLGPNLYTNIYYVLGELIANAYDADAHNVYIIQNENDIRVEDDGCGMSYKDGDIENYLHVAKESRSTNEDSFTKGLHRRKMGRKGVGKLAALSVSEDVDVLTVKNGEKSGFVLSRKPYRGNLLKPIPDEEIHFARIVNNGTAIVMHSPNYQLNKTVDTIKRNLVRIFPLINEDFIIHVIVNGKEIAIDSSDKAIVKELCVLITLGEEFKSLGDRIYIEFPQKKDKLVEKRKEMSFPLKLFTKTGEEKDYNLIIKGWIGAYKSTRGKKLLSTDFPDNFISLYANKKMGEFNILPIVGQNKLNEVYVVGQLHIDLFELSELPDIALSNRQGYRSDDLRYRKVIEYVKSRLLPDIVAKRTMYASLKKEEKKIREIEIRKGDEKRLRENVEKFKASLSSSLMASFTPSDDIVQRYKEIIDKTVNSNMPMLELKKTIDEHKKKILISHAIEDKDVADVIYKMLSYNDVPDQDILYTSCDSEECRIPEECGIFNYLRDFFVNSYSDKKMFVIFVTSEKSLTKWSPTLEVGAEWITMMEHRLFNIANAKPQKPLDTDRQWVEISVDTGSKTQYLDNINAQNFCKKIEVICAKLGYKYKGKENNLSFLSKLMEIR